ncbi:hypothetical protein PHYSODRAFT_304943 [Phytophthora sojae]|uniref:Uncharacterized protein n=1 Tax=Phytophthora sojae (strain P6497) TaxID=1094619 RepID=G5A3L3_PHYSP|nr:hypothetical protein PHYSODRAFT_304943 [Phytophthora sojae]EGZ09386.1 hypothetical protein PHYSODRAFT_304943 [Phytophthora sojae]|eukprot:XP_009534247.1 hypothetical protein PHYSODRAFT_304943 [Phytophthora sojae]
MRGPGNFSTLSEDSDSDTPRRSSGYATASMRSGPSNGVVGQKRRASSPPRPVGNSFLRPTPPGQLLFPRPIERESIWPRCGEYWMLNDRQTPRSPLPQSEKKIIDGLKLRLSKLPDTEQEGVFSASIKAAIEVVQLEQVKDEELRVEQAVKTAHAAVKCLLNRNGRSPQSDEQQHRLEDVRQILLLWCNTQLRKFLTAKYKKPAQISADDQNKLVSLVAETRDWRGINDYTVVRFKEIMAFVTEIFDGSYEDWEPQQDSRVAELVGIMIVRARCYSRVELWSSELMHCRHVALTLPVIQATDVRILASD